MTPRSVPHSGTTGSGRWDGDRRPGLCRMQGGRLPFREPPASFPEGSNRVGIPRAVDKVG